MMILSNILSIIQFYYYEYYTILVSLSILLNVILLMNIYYTCIDLKPFYDAMTMSDDYYDTINMNNNDDSINDKIRQNSSDFDYSKLILDNGEYNDISDDNFDDELSDMSDTSSLSDLESYDIHELCKMTSIPDIETKLFPKNQSEIDWNKLYKSVLNDFDNNIIPTINQCISNILNYKMTNKISLIIISYIKPPIIKLKPRYIPIIDINNNIRDSCDIKNILNTKYNGYPYLNDDEYWPKCLNCCNFIPLFLQLNIEKDIPNEHWLHKQYSGHIIQLFYCIKCNDFKGFNNSNQIRLIKINPNINIKNYEYKIMNVKSNILSIMTNKEKTYFEYYKLIQSFKRDTCFEGPLSNEFDTIFNGYDTYFRIKLFDELKKCKYFEQYMPKATDKLGGYPFWINNVDYKKCYICNNNMSLIYQTNAKYNNFMFGDCGIGHLFLCKKHPNILAFQWASG